MSISKTISLKAVAILLKGVVRISKLLNHCVVACGVLNRDNFLEFMKGIKESSI